MKLHSGTLLLLLSTALSGRLAAQLSAFRYDSARVPVGQAYHYLKSIRDGSHQGRVTVYVASHDRLESLKWDPGSAEATLVTADMDWRLFSVRHFEAWHLARGSADERRAWLDMDSSGLSVRTSLAGGSVVSLSRLPWHSYDFDFASLALVLRYWLTPEEVLLFERADLPATGDPRTFADLGGVTLRFIRQEQHAGVPARRYSIGGPGLEDSTGVLWTDRWSGQLIEFRIPIPDEPGYRDGRLRLQRVERMTPQAWARYQRSRVGE